MAKYSVKTNGLQEQAASMQNIYKTMASFEGRLHSVANTMDGRDGTMASLRVLVKNGAKSMPQIAARANAASAFLSDCQQAYQKAELDSYASFHGGYTVNLFGQDITVNAAIFSQFADLFLGDVTAWSILSVLLNGGTWGSVLEQAVGGFFGGDGTLSLQGSVDQWEDKFGKKSQDKKTKNLIGSGVTDIDKLATIIGVEAKKEVSIFETDFINNEYGKVSAKIGAAEAHGALSAGIYAVGPDGKQIFAPGVSAEIGASICALALAAEGKYGNDLLGAYGKGGLDVLKAGAKGELDVGLFSKDGKLDVKAKLSGNAEAVLVEAKGSAGATVLGTDVGVRGSVKVGVGASIDVGYANGKFSLDIGASLGIGASVGIEIDFSGTVKAVSGAATSAWNTLKGWFG